MNEYIRPRPDSGVDKHRGYAFQWYSLAVLIAVHEWGHYRAARACNVKVLRFSIGFGRPIWRRQGAETEWVVGLLPLGGYVRMLDEREGEVPPEEEGKVKP